MNRIKNILACLDLTYIDSILVEYAAFFARTVDAEKTFFLHVIQEYDLPDKGGREIPETEVLNEIIFRKIQDEVDDHFEKNQPVTIETRIEEEDASAAIIDFISEAGIDLLLIGQKHGSNREARYGHKIASGADCDVMFIPEMVEMQIRSILCAIDCSRESQIAFQRALYIADKTGAALSCYFLYDTAETYFPATTLTSAGIQQERFRKEYARFLEHFQRSPGDIQCHFREIKATENQAEMIYDAAIEDQAELIIVGAVGDISSPTTLLGNISENFNHMEKKMPLLIIRNKKTKGFFWG